MHFLLFQLALVVPFCLGRVTDSASLQEIGEEKPSSPRGGSKRLLRPSLNIRTGPAKMVEMLSGDAKYLECEAGGSPPPTIHWLKDGKKIPQSLYEAFHPENGDELLPSHLGLGFTRSRLYIDCASVRDAGKYTCVAENEYLRDSKSGQVFVADTMDGESAAICMAKKTFGSPARVNMWTHTRLEMMGTDVQLFCRSDGNPYPQVSWRGPEGVNLEDSLRHQILENGDLIIRKLVWSDMGGYTCRVKNSEGADETSVFLYPTLPDMKTKA